MTATHKSVAATPLAGASRVSMDRGRRMTVAELRALLAEYPDDMPIRISHDGYRLYAPCFVTKDANALPGEDVVVIY